MARLLWFLQILWCSSSCCSGLEVCEFFSGIGGLRAGLEQANESRGGGTLNIRAFDVNLIANSVYKHNWDDNVVCKSIEQLDIGSIKLDSDLWLLSPPCQPYCKVGRGRDVDDPRTSSLLHLLGILDGNLSVPSPSAIFLENVPEFAGSKAHAEVLRVLTLRDYSIHEFITCPSQLGVPNVRKRYYLCAHSRKGGTQEQSPIVHSTFPCMPASTAVPATVSDYLELLLTEEEVEPHLLPFRATQHASYGRADVVTRSTHGPTMTFTAGYGKHLGKAGPVLLLEQNGWDVSSEELPSRFCLIEAERRLRYFTPHEMLRIAGFPQSFSFPGSTTVEQNRKLIGNSVSVIAVSTLLMWLLAEMEKQ
jgi:tRNA (cytosine38-C5)-methyltransferase